nr:MAG TPA: hypothetical protein [Caudoviricetes sp.]
MASDVPLVRSWYLIHSHRWAGSSGISVLFMPSVHS